MEERNSEESQSAWNLSSHLIMQIGHMLQLASSQWVGGKPRDAYFSLMEIKHLVWCDLNSQEKKKLAELEARINGAIKASVQQIGDEGSFHSKITQERNEWKNQIKQKSADMFRRLVIQYRLTIMEALSRYGYLIQRKADSKRIA